MINFVLKSTTSRVGGMVSNILLSLNPFVEGSSKTMIKGSLFSSHRGSVYQVGSRAGFHPVYVPPTFCVEARTYLSPHPFTHPDLKATVAGLRVSDAGFGPTDKTDKCLVIRYHVLGYHRVFCLR